MAGGLSTSTGTRRSFPLSAIYDAIWTEPSPKGLVSALFANDGGRLLPQADFSELGTLLRDLENTKKGMQILAQRLPVIHF